MSRENFVIKLSENKDKSKETAPVYINPSHIVGLSPSATGTLITLTGGTTVSVIESVDQIQKKGAAYAIFKVIE